ncbi:hypothetical protein VTN00DRAFT_2754 [Thermoascus crustaceus]|uniref:uncharacterized protein n=1 Tax=Thermoascus crustaceus TaxID=5088 RepID=UPI0037424CCA
MESKQETSDYHLPPLPSPPITEAQEATPESCHSSCHLSRMSIDALLNPKGSDDSESKPQTLALQYYKWYPPSPYSHHHPQYYGPHCYPEKSLMLHNKPSGLTLRTGSTHSSPGPYRCHRFNSVSSKSTTVSESGRPPRPKYEEEEMYFIWYYRVDLNQEWKEVRESFNRQFPTRQRRGFQGIQCKFYRFIREKECPTLREQRRMRNGEFIARNGSKCSETLPRFGVVQWMGVWYPWMRESKAQVLSQHAAAKSARL